jgi:hypothetical protein
VQDFRREHAELASRFGSSPQSADVIWSLFQNIAQQRREPIIASGLYRTMAEFLEEEGKDPSRCLEEALRFELLSYREQEIVGAVSIWTPHPDPCSECAELIGRVYSLREAIATMPLPCPGCTRSLQNPNKGFCRCRWGLGGFDFG